MLQAVIGALRVKELRDRIFFNFFAFFVFVLTIHITVPGVNYKEWERLLESQALFSFLGMFTGGALNKFAITAMGITPYINASIIMQLLTIVIPKLEELAKEGGEMGRKQISKYTRFLTIGLAFLQSGMMVFWLQKQTEIFLHKSVLFYIITVFSLTAGTAFLMWLGEQISDKGIGNGVSLLIFAGIVLRYPNYLGKTLQVVHLENIPNMILFGVIAILLVMAIVMINQGQRRVPVQYAKRIVGRRVMGGQSTYIPIRVNNAGVISIIFAISILYFPSTVLGYVTQSGILSPNSSLAQFFHGLFDPGSWFYNLCYALLVIFFTYFYAAITFNIMDVADNMKKYGGFIPGIRPGRPTAEHLEKILSRVTFVAAIFLAVIAVLPTFVMQLTRVHTFYLGSTSLLIIVGVALDTMQQIEARLMLRHYQGFMK
ncbi:MAG: preprotein translocase subunit SecY [Armatimonadetes bacterium]|nr:preprotein translocase subunit SecY [Armatimonadota bacterium]